MPRSRPASRPLSYHKHTGQYYVTRKGKRVYLGADEPEALKKYHRLALGVSMHPRSRIDRSLTAKELANRFLAIQQANWRAPETTLKSYTAWLGRFLRDYTSVSWLSPFLDTGFPTRLIEAHSSAPRGDHASRYLNAEAADSPRIAVDGLLRAAQSPGADGREGQEVGRERPSVSGRPASGTYCITH